MVDFFTDINDRERNISQGTSLLISRLAAFFVTGDSIVTNNLVQSYQFTPSTYVSLANFTKKHCMYNSISCFSIRISLMLGVEPQKGSNKPFSFIDVQDVQELAKSFERRVSTYQMSISGELQLDAAF